MDCIACCKDDGVIELKGRSNERPFSFKSSDKPKQSGEPFGSASGRLREAVLATVREHCPIAPEQSTGGTSDGRFIAPLGAEVVELGPVNATIHKVDECVAVEDLSILGRLYRAILSKVLD